jgi:hypothetical protein
MKRTTLTASLVGSAAAGLMAVAVATPAWSQATTYPEGTDCSAISNSASRMECMNQLNESRQAPDTGEVAPAPDGAGNIQPGVPATSPADAAPAATGTGNPGTGTPGGGPAGQPGDTPGPGGGASGVSN